MFHRWKLLNQQGDACEEDLPGNRGPLETRAIVSTVAMKLDICTWRIQQTDRTNRCSSEWWSHIASRPTLSVLTSRSSWSKPFSIRTAILDQIPRKIRGPHTSLLGIPSSSPQITLTPGQTQTKRLDTNTGRSIVANYIIQIIPTWSIATNYQLIIFCSSDWQLQTNSSRFLHLRHACQ